ncbi:MAG TPA: DUF87 domain-containing protein [Paludibaculum sp.]|jgi:DNA-binding MarR family transcriptional regulator
MMPDRYAERSPDLFRRLKPLYGRKIDLLWYEYQTADQERRREIEGLLTLVAAKRLGMAVGEERISLEPPPAGLIGRGEYEIGNVEYPGINPYPFRLGPQELLRHLFILGPTGTGKSTLILGVLQQFLHAGVPFMVFDFKRNYRCLLPTNPDVLVVTVGRESAPLAVNALAPPPGVDDGEWAQSLSDVIGNAYLLLQGAGNVLKEALSQARRERGEDATLVDAHELVTAELQSLRPGSRRYGWLESTGRSIDELTKGGFGKSLNAVRGVPLATFLDRPVVFELQGLGDDQKRFFCLYVLQYLLFLRKHDSRAREVLQHVLVFDEGHNVFPKDQFGEHSVPSRLAREVREYGEAIIAATQQTDVSDSLIANSGTKIILRTDFPRDVEFASRLLHVDPKWLPRLPLGTGIVRLPTRYYQPFIFTFAEQPQKNVLVSDAEVGARFDQLGGLRAPAAAPQEEMVSVSAQEHALLVDIAQEPIAGITARYERLGWHAKTGNTIKDRIIEKGLARFEDVPTATARIKILTLTPEGEQYLAAHGIARAPGRRGGPAHEYWRQTLRRVLERHRYAVAEEFPIGAGRAVDLYGSKGAHHVYVEIETGKADVAANIAKIAGMEGSVVFFFVTPELRQGWADQLPAGALGLGPGDLDAFAQALR